MSTTASIAIQDITGMVLAGGRGSRMGGVDKGLQPFHGVPLALHALQRLQPKGTTEVLCVGPRSGQPEAKAGGGQGDRTQASEA